VKEDYLMNGTLSLDPSAVSQQIQELGDVWAEAERKKDIKKVSQILADNFHFTGTRGHLISREEWLSMIPKMNLVKFDRSDIQVRLLGDTAVLTGVVDLENKLPDKTVAGVYRYADLFVYKDGRWQVFYSHFTPIQSNN
jgi:ketosteroid isomerase-like protein